MYLCTFALYILNIYCIVFCFVAVLQDFNENNSFRTFLSFDPKLLNTC